LPAAEASYHRYQRRRRDPAVSAERKTNPSSHRTKTMRASIHRRWRAKPPRPRRIAISRIARIRTIEGSFREMCRPSYFPPGPD
jgi:hypothetical protein